MIGATPNRSVATRDYPATFPAATASADAPVQRRFLETLVHQFDYQAVTVENGDAGQAHGLDGLIDDAEIAISEPRLDARRTSKLSGMIPSKGISTSPFSISPQCSVLRCPTKDTVEERAKQLSQ